MIYGETKNKMSILVNPAVVFSLSWFSVLLGMQVKWSDLIVETPFILTVTIYSTIVSSLMAFIVVRYLLPRKKHLNVIAPMSDDRCFSGARFLGAMRSRSV
jgi:ABC-type spermidine/putrescine transport system permease subunit II